MFQVVKQCILDHDTKICAAATVSHSNEFGQTSSRSTQVIASLEENPELRIPIVSTIVGYGDNTMKALTNGQTEKQISKLFGVSASQLVETHPLRFSICRTIDEMLVGNTVTAGNRYLYAIVDHDISRVIGFANYSVSRQLYYVQPLCNFVPLKRYSLMYSNITECSTFLRATRAVQAQIEKYKSNSNSNAKEYQFW
jgi:hypothetical protein